MGQLSTKSRTSLSVAGATLGSLAAIALANVHLARRAERQNPPFGRFLNVDNVGLHYIDTGSGEPLVFFHGNGSMIEEIASSGLITELQANHRVIVFDRPGFGHSGRPRGVSWNARNQAALFRRALSQLGIPRARFVGHSWGASVAMATALHYPDAVKDLVLISGYYFPTARADAALLSAPAMPVLGDVMRYTATPIAARLLWPRVKARIFAPQLPPEKFERVPVEMMFRPSQLRASAEEAAFLVPDAAAAQDGYPKLSMPIVIIAGDEDEIVDTAEQSGRLRQVISHSVLLSVAGAGHMVHQTETATVLSAIANRQTQGNFSCRV